MLRILLHHHQAGALTAFLVMTLIRLESPHRGRCQALPLVSCRQAGPSSLLLCFEHVHIPQPPLLVRSFPDEIDALYLFEALIDTGHLEIVLVTPEC